MAYYWSLLSIASCASAETNLERGKRIVNDCLQALGGDRYLKMTDRVETRARLFVLSRASQRVLRLPKSTRVTWIL